MLAEIETRKVSLAKWWNPFTWGKFIMEWRYLWDANNAIEQIALIGLDNVSSQINDEWKQSIPPVLLILNRNTLNETSFYVNEEDLCQQK